MTVRLMRYDLVLREREEEVQYEYSTTVNHININKMTNQVVNSPS